MSNEQKATLDSPRYVFDGFAYRPYSTQLDGWRDEQPLPSQFPCVLQAQSVLDLFAELCTARRELWQLRKELAHYKQTYDAPVFAKKESLREPRETTGSGGSSATGCDSR